MTATARIRAYHEAVLARHLEGAGGQRPRTRREYAKDAAFAVLVAAGSVVFALLAPDGRTESDALAWALLAAGGLSLVARHRHPRAVLAVTVLAVLVYQLRGYPDGSPVLPVLVAVYRCVRAGHRRFTITSTLAGLVVSMGSLPFTSLGDEALRAALERRFLLFGWVVACAMAAGMRGKHEAYVAEVEQRAEENARRRADEERLRIARELHDTLTHSISVIKVQAGVAVHLAKKRGDEAPPALLAIQEASGDAARELRATLHVLRSTDGDGGDGVGLDRLPQLVERARSGGVPVTVDVAGERRPLPAEVDRAAYRIVQESLTNAARHAGPSAAVVVRIGYGPDLLTVRVDDDGTASPDAPPTPGIGLTGMRERVAALGGELLAAPRPEGGFGVRAELPLAVRLPAARTDTDTGAAAGAEAAVSVEPAVAEGGVS